MEQLSTVLALNCGSSSLKFGLYRCEKEDDSLICEGEAEEVGTAHGSFWTKASATAEKQEEKVALKDHAAAVRHALDLLKQWKSPEVSAVGHRFVHGGPLIREHRRITPELYKQLQAAVDYAPLHMPPALAALDEVQRVLPNLPEIACFDTVFHRTMPDVSRIYALPEAVRQQGVERFGFHGLSLESILPQLSEIPENLIVAHLGNGSSITAIHRGESIDTSMGLTPTGGVMMGTRCGDLDPGVAIYLLRHGQKDAEALEKLFDKQSGLLGVSGISSDVRELIAARSKNEGADLALRMFCYQVRKTIAGMAAAMNGLNTLVFTGGIGEHASDVRNAICSGLEFLGKFQTLVLPAQEDIQIARISARILADARSAGDL